MPKPTPELPPTPENLLPDEALVEGHHPTGLNATDAAKIVADSLSHQKPCEMIVLAARWLPGKMTPLSPIRRTSSA